MNFSQLFPVRISTVYIYPLVLRPINPIEKLSTSSEVPQNHNDLPSTIFIYSCFEMNLKTTEVNNTIVSLENKLKHLKR